MVLKKVCERDFWVFVMGMCNPIYVMCLHAFDLILSKDAH